MSDYYSSPNDPRAVREIAEKYGFCLVKGLFSPAEIEDFEARAAAVPRLKDGGFPDLYSCPSLRHAMLDERVRNIAHELLGPDLVYYRETAIAYEDTPGALTDNPFTEFHCDAKGTRDNLQKFWNGNDGEVYPAYRFALYFRNYRDYSGGLKVGVRTHVHKSERFRQYYDAAGVRTLPITPQWVENYILDLPSAPFELYNVPSVPGDLVIFNLRTFHSAGALRYRSRPGFATLPIVDEAVKNSFPDLLLPPSPGCRNALFFDYGARSEALDYYIKWRALESAGTETATAPLCEEAIPGIQIRNDRAILAIGTLLTVVMKSAKIDLDAVATTQCEKIMRSELGAKFIRLCLGHVQYSPYHPHFDVAGFQVGYERDPKAAFLKAIREIRSAFVHFRERKKAQKSDAGLPPYPEPQPIETSKYAAT